MEAPARSFNVTIPDGWSNPTVKQLNTEHKDFTDLKDDLVKINMLYDGGHVIRKNATQFLRRRPAELQEVYQSRVDQFNYHNILGTCFGWYRAAMFKNPPTIEMKTENGGKVDEKAAAFYEQFQKNCDRKGTALIDIFREIWTYLALYRTAYVLVDLPVTDPQETRSRADQRKAGVLSEDGKPAPLLIPYSPLAVINWSEDKYGVLEWVVLSYHRSDVGFVQQEKTVDTWFYFDREKYIKYERQRQEKETSLSAVNGAETVSIVDAGRHALAAVGRVPLLRFEVPDALWLANRAYLPTLAHLNQDNSYSWALFMSNLAMPVVTSNQEIKVRLAEAGFIQLPEGATYQWSEPQGTSFVHSANRVKELREEIFRAMYLTYQGRSSTATADGASGASKEMDMMPANDVMNEYGDVVRGSMQNTLDAVAQARGDVGVVSDVRGLSFGKTTTLESIEKTEAALAIGVPSDTFEKELYKRSAAEYLSDANPETLQKVYAEIDASPSREEKQQAVAEAQRQQFANGLESAMQKAAGPRPPKPAQLEKENAEKETTEE